MNKQDEFEAAYRELIMVSNHPDLRERYQWLHERIGELADHLRALRGVPLETVMAALDQALGGVCCPGKEQDCPWDRYRLETLEKMREALKDYGYGDDDD